MTAPANREQLRAVAEKWATEYIEAQQEVDFVGLFDCMEMATWKAHLEFITDCFQHGFKPMYFLDYLIKTQNSLNCLVQDMLDDDDDDNEF